MAHQAEAVASQETGQGQGAPHENTKTVPALHLIRDPVPLTTVEGVLALEGGVAPAPDERVVVHHVPVAAASIRTVANILSTRRIIMTKVRKWILTSQKHIVKRLKLRDRLKLRPTA